MMEFVTAYLSEREVPTTAEKSGFTHDPYGLVFVIRTAVENAYFTAYINHDGDIVLAAVDMAKGTVDEDVCSLAHAIHDGIIPELQYLAAQAMKGVDAGDAIVGELGEKWARNWELNGFVPKDMPERLPYRPIFLENYPYPSFAELFPWIAQASD